MGKENINRGHAAPFGSTNLEVDNFRIALEKELPEITELIKKNFSDSNAKFNNMVSIEDMFNTKIAKSMFAIAYWTTEEDIIKVKALMEKEDMSRVKVDPVFEVLSELIVDRLGFEYPTYSIEDIKTHILNTYKLLRIMERAPYKFPLVLEDFKILRKFIRNNIRPVKPAGDLSMHSIDARSALLQEVRKFDPFYITLFLELDGIILDSKFKQYHVQLVGEDAVIKNLKRLISKVERFRAKVVQKENGKIYIETKRESLEINIRSYIKKKLD